MQNTRDIEISALIIHIIGHIDIGGIIYNDFIRICVHKFIVPDVENIIRAINDERGPVQIIIPADTSFIIKTHINDAEFINNCKIAANIHVPTCTNDVIILEYYINNSSYYGPTKCELGILACDCNDDKKHYVDMLDDYYHALTYDESVLLLRNLYKYIDNYKQSIGDQ